MPPSYPEFDPDEKLVMTDQMAPVDEATMYRRRIDDSLARFSAAHDELAQEEEEKRQRWERFTAKPVQFIEQTKTSLQRVISPHTEEEADSKKPDEAEAADAGETAVEAEGESTATRLQEKKLRRNMRSEKIVRICAAVLAGIIFLATGTAWGAKAWYNSGFDQISALDENSNDINNASGQRGDENFLIIGSDTRAGAEAEEHVGDSNEVPGARADTMMIAHIPADRSRVIAVSFPRDLEISRPECKKWDHIANKETTETVPAARITKLNSVYTLGGPRCLTKMVQQLTGIKVNHFIGIDFNGFKEMVDAAGGVNVHLESPINDEVLGNIFPTAGDITISGDQALNFVRARHVKGDPTSDYGRIKRQQQFIGSLLKKAMSKEVMFDFNKLNGFITAFSKATFGDNLGIDQLLTLAQSMKGMDSGKITFLTVPTTGNSNSRGNEVLMKEKAALIFQALIENTPLPDDNAPTGSSTAPSTSASKSKQSKSAPE